jgi:putative endonuclease
VSEARRMRRLAGRRAEIVGALCLMAKGDRVLGFRLQTPPGEIQLLVSRGPVLAAVKVKTRTSIEAALEAANPAQRQRLRRTLNVTAGRREGMGASIRLDLLALAPGSFPRHIPGVRSEDADLS